MKIIFLLTIGFIETFIANMFFSKFGNKKLIPKRHFLICLSYCFFHVLNAIAFEQSFFLFVFAIIITFLFSCFFNIKLSMKLITSFIFSIVMALSESLTVMAITLGSDIEVDSIQSSPIMYILVIVLSKFIPYTIFKLINSKKTFLSNGLSLKFFICIFLLPFSSIFVIILLYIYSFEINFFNFQLSTFIAAFLLIIANISIFYIIDKQEDYISTKNRLSFAEDHIKNQIKHYNELYEQQEELKKFKHDSKNLYIALLSKLKTMSTNDAINEVAEMMKITFDNTVFNSGNPVIDALINSKMAITLKLGIKFNPTIKITSPININELEIAVLIGNALDNAIEANQNISKTSEKYINIHLITIDEMISIKIENPVDSFVDTNTLPTTKNDKTNHGYGINEIKTIVNKYNGLLNITCQDRKFILSASLVNNNG